MAPELRKRKPVPEAQKSNGVSKTADKPSPKGKRKAAEDASPVSLKKQKPSKKAAPSQKPTAKSPKETKPKKTAKKAEEEEDVLELDDSDDSEDEDNENVKALAAEIDSDDEAPADKAVAFKPGQDVGKIPSVTEELAKAAKEATGEPGVLYIGRIPHGFYEHEMRQYLSQFGPVTRVRLSRNKKTGASKHFAFVEFEEATTAEIVAKTMDNYLLFGHILKCKTIPKEQVHEDLFKGANRRFKKVPWNKMAGLNLQKPLAESTWKTKVSKEKSKRAKQAAKFKDMGYEFDAPDLKNVPPPQAAEDSVEEPKAIEAEPEEHPAKEETKASKKSKAKASAAETESIPTPKAKPGRVTKGKAKKGKA
ncbi:ribosomal biogenesis protein Gar2 [Metarhizium rileyi]|uniref:Ribosomal biogenesis protein Gar2 n=1 Tax=Metarhizium rileyi (strain RCEF 4871) TaxID=1649241 RepID=A0A162JMM9_METRR|nr:ribosomal biogenesis protein Gar2 [Metarhizium rileyi RCEF 4871]TWU75679.1 hypothetical protein ED733_007353 [Metarhizium rileyi]